MKEQYDERTDFGTVDCSNAFYCIMGEGRFIICMTDEPHRPGIRAVTDSYLKKCVVKVLI